MPQFKPLLNNGRLTIPQNIREKMKLQEGDTIVISIEEEEGRERIILEPLTNLEEWLKKQ